MMRKQLAAFCVLRRYARFSNQHSGGLYSDLCGN